MTLHRHLVDAVVLALREIFANGRPAERTVGGHLRSHLKWGARDRRFFAESVYEIVRHWRRLWHLAGLPAADFCLSDRITTEAVWKVWLAWWIDVHGAAPSMEMPVSLIPSEVVQRGAAISDLAVAGSLPAWIHRKCDAAYGERWPDLLEALNNPADVFLRANRLKITRDELRKRLAKEEVASEIVAEAPDGLRLVERRNLATSPVIRDGLAEVQDAGSQMIAPLLGAQPGEFVIDACAGAGGKTLHLAALMENQGRLLALDVEQAKLGELEERCQRGGATIVETQLLTGKEAASKLPAGADRVLLDVPCSGMGVLRRSPDTKWKLNPKELTRLVALQADILKKYAAMVKPGGTLVYATCSILPEENEAQVAAFLETKAGASWRLDKEYHLFPDRQNSDGFYAAILQR
ncbi:MAG: class I SAM-dependent methyltransferase [Verrucomicrobiales bacterium]|nr:class I SAM-dependent methyltransferase [Verrucomicrobiales bacterium]